MFSEPTNKIATRADLFPIHHIILCAGCASGVVEWRFAFIPSPITFRRTHRIKSHQPQNGGKIATAARKRLVAALEGLRAATRKAHIEKIKF